MKISDLINALEYIKKIEGDLPVLEERCIWYDSYEYFKNNININNRVKEICQCQMDNEHRYNDKGYYKEYPDYKEFKALIL